MTRIRAITFDAGGTLIEPWPSVGAVYADVAAEFQIACDIEKINRAFATAWQARSAFGYTRAEWFDVVRHSFRDLCEVTPGMFDAIYERFAESRCWRIYDDVLPALERIQRAGLQLAVISNWDERLTLLLEQLGLARHFQAIIVSGTIGAHKPERRIFDETAEQLSLSPAEILHIGDSETEDVLGARAAGFRALRIRRQGRVKDYDIECLAELPCDVR